MPFTPFHLGPGLLLKAFLQGSFSLMVFGWSQVIMDIQPLLVMLTGEGHLHGFSHTYIGAIVLAIFSALTGKYLAELGLILLGLSKQPQPVVILWRVSFVSALIGTLTHVLLDSIMHIDVQPFYPVVLKNDFYGLLNFEQLHKLCLYSGLLGAFLYYMIQLYIKKSFYSR